VQAAIVDEAELRQLARLVARLTPGQQRFVVALADGFRGDGWSRSSGSAPGEAATSAMRACSAMTEPGSLVVQVGASTGETTPADHPAVLALLSPGSLTASRSLRRHLARKV
jgi:hypothetical protein